MSSDACSWLFCWLFGERCRHGKPFYFSRVALASLLYPILWLRLGLGLLSIPGLVGVALMFGVSPGVGIAAAAVVMEPIADNAFGILLVGIFFSRSYFAYLSLFCDKQKSINIA